MTDWRRVSGSAFGLVAGFVIWASAFVSIYAAVSLGCAMNWDDTSLGLISLLRLIPAFLLALHLALLGALLYLACRKARARRGYDFLLTVHAITVAFALAATLWTGSPLLLASTCSAADTAHF